MRAGALLLIAAASCKPDLVPGRFTCTVGDATGCPPDWYCQVRDKHDLRCYPDRNGPHCGDGTRDSFEVCDANDTCAEHAFYGDGRVQCNPTCTAFVATACGGYCGDGMIEEGFEECDGLDQNGESCSTLDSFSAGALGCSSDCKRTFDACTGWQLVYASPSVGEGPLTGVWFASQAEGFAVGCEMPFLHYRGSQWTPEVAPNSASLCFQGIAGDTADNVYAVGWSGQDNTANTVLHYHDHSWSELEFSPLAGHYGLYGVWDAGHGDVYFTGHPGLYHYVESTPSQVQQVFSTMAFGGEGGYLYGVWGRAADDVYAVGAAADCTFFQPFCYMESPPPPGPGRIVHWNGSEARVVHEEPGGSDFWGIWGGMGAADDIYAVGSGGLFQSGDGLGWSPVALQPPVPEDTFYASIWGASASDVFTSFNSRAEGVKVYRFDGAFWRPTTSGLVDSEIESLAGSATSVFAVGQTGNPRHAAIWTFREPVPWVTMSSHTSSALNAITGTLGGDLFAVGAQGTLLRFDGNDWAPWTSATNSDLYAAWWSPESGTVFAGGNQMVLRCKSGSCTRETLNRDASELGKFKAIWGSSGENVFASTVESPPPGNLIWHLVGGDWSAVNQSFTLCTAFRGLWGDGPDVSAVGTYLGPSGGHYLCDQPQARAMAAWHFTTLDDHWISIDPPLQPGELTAVWGTSKSHVFAVASDGTILHYDGSAWQVSLPQQGRPLNSIWGRSARDVYAVGQGGVVLHYDGASWTPLDSGTTATLNGVWADPVRGVYAVGEGGVIVHLANQLPTIPGGECASPVPIYCKGPSPYFGDTRGATAKFDSYGCSGRQLTGREVYYRFDSPIDGRIVGRLAAHDADLDLVVVGAEFGGGCAPADRCLADGQATPTTEAQVAVSVEKGQTYYLIVDAAEGAASGYTLSLECKPE